MWVGRRVAELPTPAFVVDEAVARRNAERMLQRCGALGLRLRPLMKTHKTLEGGELMTGGTRRGIAVSTLAEARFFAAGGFDDILYAYPLPFDKLEECAELAQRLEAFQVLVDSRDALAQLRRRRLARGVRWLVWMKLDCGNGRAGLRHTDPGALELARAIAQEAPEEVALAGVYAHCGNTYGCSGVSEIQAVAQATTAATLEFVGTKNNQLPTGYAPIEGHPDLKLQEAGVPCPASSIGSTPSCSHPVADMGRLTEVHPGNYIFYDLQQVTIGSCQLEDVAVRVLTRVIGHYPHRNQLLVDCGWAGLSLHGLGQLPTGYALLEGHPDLKLVGMTQEHGRVEPVVGALDFSKFPLGSLLALIPYHLGDRREGSWLGHIPVDGGVVLASACGARNHRDRLLHELLTSASDDE